MKMNCNICNKVFFTFPSQIKNGGGKYCSKPCYWKSKLGKKPSEKTRKAVGERHKGENSYLWKGEEVSYAGLHIWVKRWLGSPNTCEKCEKSGLDNRHIHWANKSHQYKRDLTDWIRLCVPCHRKYDNDIPRNDT